MIDDLAASGNALLERLLPLVAQDAELLGALRSLAVEFLQRTEPRVEAPPEAAASAPQEAAAVESVAPMVESAEVRHVALPMNAGIEIPVGWSRQVAAAPEADLSLIVQRCRLKVEGARWALARQELIRKGANYHSDVEPRDREIIAKARELKDCFLWMNHSNAPIPPDMQQWEDVAGCFESLAMAVSLLQQLSNNGDRDRDSLEKAYDLAAEAQSALRVAVEAVGAKPDTDQKQVFDWLHHKAYEQQVFIPRYMRLADPADPTGWHDLEERIGQLESQVDEGRKREKQREKTFKKGMYHARRLRNGNGGPDDWRKVIDVVDALVAEGTPPSSLDLREMLEPIIDDLPEDIDLPANFRLVMNEIDRYLAAQAPPTQQVVREASEEVQKVARLYEGKTMVIIGGECRTHAYESLKTAFRLKELIWIATREHESIDVFVPYVKRADVDAVLLAIRWSSHSYGEVRDLCMANGKEFFRLPAGYNANQVAFQILQQRGG